MRGLDGVALAAVASVLVSDFALAFWQPNPSQKQSERTAMFMELAYPGGLELLANYQSALNDCDIQLFTQTVNDNAWLIGFPKEYGHDFFGNRLFFEELCNSGASFNVEISPPSGTFWEDGYVLLTQVVGERANSDGDVTPIDEVISLVVRENEDGGRQIVHSHSSPLPITDD